MKSARIYNRMGQVVFPHSCAVIEWFTAHPRMLSLFLPPYSPFLNFIEEVFSSWRWKVYGHHQHDRMFVLDAMNVGRLDISDCQEWIRSAKRFFPRCIAQDDIKCDVDENLQPNPEWLGVLLDCLCIYKWPKWLTTCFILFWIYSILELYSFFFYFLWSSMTH